MDQHRLEKKRAWRRMRRERGGQTLVVLFPLGRTIATPSTLAAVDHERLLECLDRHNHGDWGCLSPENLAANDRAVEEKGRILSAYPIDPEKPCQGFCDNTFWIITEADRTATTCLLPSENL